MPKVPRLLFIYAQLVPFVREDLNCLEKNYRVTTFQVKMKNSSELIITLIRQFFILLFTGWRYQKVYIWFGDYHSFLPVLFAWITGKQSYLVVGGYDVCRIRELNYGSFKNPIRGFMTRFSMNHCTLNLCVSNYVERKVKWIAPSSVRQLIYNGVPTDLAETQIPEKENIVLTVGTANSEKRIRLKGIDIFAATAKTMPEYQFVIIGCKPELLEMVCGQLPANLRVYPVMKSGELRDFYARAKVYCQFSRIESFCMTLAEAMLCNCIPVINNVGGMPEVAGDCEFCISPRHPEKIKDSIEKAMAQSISGKPRERILSLFTFNKRRAAILEALR